MTHKRDLKGEVISLLHCGAMGTRKKRPEPIHSTDSRGRAPTYAEVLEAARRARKHIEETWPAWKRALSQAEPDR